MRRAAAALLAIGLLTAVPGTAQAAPFTINVGTFSGGTGVLHAPGTIADGLRVYLGAVLITGDLGTFESYCVDLQHYAVIGANTVDVGVMSNWNNPATTGYAGLGGRAASWLYNTYAASAVGNKARQAALSLAIWNSLYDTDYNVLAGTGFRASSLSNLQYAVLANAMLGALDINKEPLPNNMFLQTQNIAGTRYAQDFIGPPPTPVPAPPTILLLGLGLGCAAGFMRRRARHSA